MEITDSRDEQQIEKVKNRCPAAGKHRDKQQTRRAIELSETKCCSIVATLHDAVELVSKFEIVGAGGEGTGEAPRLARANLPWAHRRTINLFASMKCAACVFRPSAEMISAPAVLTADKR